MDKSYYEAEWWVDLIYKVDLDDSKKDLGGLVLGVEGAGDLAQSPTGFRQSHWAVSLGGGGDRQVPTQPRPADGQRAEQGQDWDLRPQHAQARQLVPVPRQQS